MRWRKCPGVTRAVRAQLMRDLLEQLERGDAGGHARRDGLHRVLRHSACTLHHAQVGVLDASKHVHVRSGSDDLRAAHALQGEHGLGSAAIADTGAGDAAEHAPERRLAVVGLTDDDHLARDLGESKRASVRESRKIGSSRGGRTRRRPSRAPATSRRSRAAAAPDRSGTPGPPREVGRRRRSPLPPAATRSGARVRRGRTRGELTAARPRSDAQTIRGRSPRRDRPGKVRSLGDREAGTGLHHDTEDR